MSKTVKLPPLLSDAGEMSNLGVACCNEIVHSETGKGALPRRWERNELLYNLDPDATNLNLVEGLESYPIPLWKPKADRIIGTVFKSITGLTPYCQVYPQDGKAEHSAVAARLALALTKVAEHHSDRHGFSRAFRQCLKIAVNTGVAILYAYADATLIPMARSQDGSYRLRPGATVRHEAIHPKDFMIYPHELGSIARASSVGHRYWHTRQEIEDLYEDGVYLTNEVGGADIVGERGGKSGDFGLTSDTPSNVPADQLIECWQLVRRCDLGEGLCDYIICVSFKTKKVLMVKKLPYETGRMYFDVRYDDEYGSFWPASSPGQDIQGVQLIYSDLFNVLIHGGYAAAFPGVALIGATLNSKVKRWGPGTVWELPAGASVQVVGNTFNGEHLVKLIPEIEDLGDSISRISTLGTSENMPPGTTATAAAGFLQAQAEGKDQYSDFVSPSVGNYFTFLRELVTVHYDAILEGMDSDLGLESFDDVTMPAEIKATGSGSTTSPNTLIQKLQLALSLAGNPMSSLDYQAVEKQVLEALDLPFDVVGLEKPPGPSAQDLMALIAGMLSGQVSPQEAAQVLQEAQAANTQTTGASGLDPLTGTTGAATGQGIGPGPAPGAVPGGPTPQAPGPGSR